MKKLIAIICFSIFAMGSANSEIIAGISGNLGMLDAKGTESVDGGNSADIFCSVRTAAVFVPVTAIELVDSAAFVTVPINREIVCLADILPSTQPSL